MSKTSLTREVVKEADKDNPEKFLLLKFDPPTKNPITGLCCATCTDVNNQGERIQPLVEERVALLPFLADKLMSTVNKKGSSPSAYFSEQVVITSCVLNKLDGIELLVLLNARLSAPTDSPLECEIISDVPTISTISTISTLPTSHATTTDDAGTCGKCVPKMNVCDVGKVPGKIHLTVRVLYTAQIRSFSNGNGEFFRTIVEDVLTTPPMRIEVVAFTDACRTFRDMFEENKITSIKGGKAKQVNANYSKTGHSHEIVLDKTSIIDLVNVADIATTT